MNTCPNCYNQSREKARFCNKCGHRFGSSQNEVPPPTAPIDISAGEAYVEIPSNQYALERLPRENSFSIDKMEVDVLKAKARNMVKLFSIVAGGLTLIWLPFLDIVFLLPLQCTMVVSIARLFGQKLSFNMAKDLITTCLAGTAGFLGAYVCGNFIPYIGKLMTAPIIFACTYGSR